MWIWSHKWMENWFGDESCFSQLGRAGQDRARKGLAMPKLPESVVLWCHLCTARKLEEFVPRLPLSKNLSADEKKSNIPLVAKHRKQLSALKSNTRWTWYTFKICLNSSHYIPGWQCLCCIAHYLLWAPTLMKRTSSCLKCRTRTVLRQIHTHDSLHRFYLFIPFIYPLFW